MARRRIRHVQSARSQLLSELDDDEFQDFFDRNHGNRSDSFSHREGQQREYKSRRSSCSSRLEMPDYDSFFMASDEDSLESPSYRRKSSNPEDRLYDGFFSASSGKILVRKLTLSKKGRLVKSKVSYKEAVTFSDDSAEGNLLSAELPLDKKRVYNVAILGGGDTGKTSILKRFLAADTAEDMYDSSVKAEGASGTMSVVLDDLDLSIAFFVAREYDPHRPMDIYLIVFSVMSRESYMHAVRVLHVIRQHMGEEAPIILVANKSDLVRGRQVTKEEIVREATAQSAKLAETSTSLDTGVDELLAGLARQLQLRHSPAAHHTRKTSFNRFFSGLKGLLVPTHNAHKSRSCSDLYRL